MNRQDTALDKPALIRVSAITLVVLALFSCAVGFAPESREPAYEFDLSQWKITLPDGSERNSKWLAEGGTVPGEFYYNLDGSMVFRSPSVAGTTANSRYSRSELREMLMGSNSGGITRGITKNNWVFSSSDEAIQQQAGAIDGTLRATLQVDQVSTTGKPSEVGVVIVGQIHASDDEPMRLHYRKLPANTRGAIYFAHETPRGDDTWYEIIGSMGNDAADPEDGIALGERFSYEVTVRGLELSVSILRPGKPDANKTITMHSGYSNDWMYFKAGAYNQSNVDLTPDQSDYVQVTFFELNASHP